MEARWNFDAVITKAFKDENGKMHVKAIASDNLEDKHGDRMSTGAIISMAKQANKNATPILPSHHDAFSIGKVFEAKAIHKKTRVQFFLDAILDEDMPQSEKLFNSVKKGNRDFQLSIGGFINLDNEKAIEFEEGKDGHIVRVINDLKLDHIAVTRKDMAANPRTGFRGALVKSLQDSIAGLQDVGKAVVPFKATAKADVGQSWSFTATDGNKLIDRGGIRLFRSAHTWFDSEKPELKTSHKLPHHKISADGTFKVVFRGVVAAGAVFAGARGGLNVPAKDRSGIASHLRRHYKQFDKEVPPALKEDQNFDIEKCIFDMDEFLKFHTDQNIEMDWFEDWIEKSDEALYGDDEKMAKKDKDVNKKDEDKDAENKDVKDEDINKDEDDDETSNEEKLASVVKDMLADLTEVHKSDDGEVTEDQIKIMKSIRDDITEFLKEVSPEDEADEDETDEDDNEEKDDIGEKLEALKKNMNENNIEFAKATKNAFEELGGVVKSLAKSVRAITKNKQKSGRISDDDDDDELNKDDKGNGVWHGVLYNRNAK